MAPSVLEDRRVGLLTDFVTRLQALEYSPSTVQGYRRAAQRLLETYSDLPFERLTPEHVERHLFARSVSARTKALELEQLRAFFKYLVRQKVVGENPCRGAERPRWKESHRPAPSWEDFLSLCQACRNPEESLIIELPYFTGLRLAEFRMLRWSQVDPERRRIRIIGKGGKERTTVFPERLKGILQSSWNGEWVFASTNHPGHPRCAWWIESTTSRIGRDAGLPYRLTPHLLRHGFARLCKTREVPLEVVSKLMGHSSIQTTARIYGRMDEDDLQKAYDRHILGNGVS